VPQVIGRKEIVADHILVKLSDFAPPEALATLNGKYGTEIRAPGPADGVYLLKLPKVELGAVERAVQAFSKESQLVAYAEPDFIVHATDVLPNDPQFSKQWNLRNIGQTGGTVRADIDMNKAWALTTGSRTIKVGVIDTGIDYHHEDLAANIWTNPGGIAGDPFTNDLHGWNFAYGTNDPMDDHFHGTHVAGIIGAVGNNGLDVSGVNWSVSLVAIKFLDSTGSGATSDAASAVRYATTIGVDVTSNSWAGGGYSQTLKDAIDQANAAGILFIAAAGNEASNNDLTPVYPASYTSANIIAVAATDDNDALAGFSNTGASSVNLGAPGVNILSTLPTNVTAAMQTYGIPALYGQLSGTSMATPHVSGTVALLKSLHPGFSASQLKQGLLGTVDAIPALSGKTTTGGRLNAARALVGSDAVPPGTITDLASTGTTESTVILRWTAPGNDGTTNGPVDHYELRYSTGTLTAATFGSGTLVTAAPVPGNPGTVQTFIVTGLLATQTYTFAVRSFDLFNASAVSNIVTATTTGPVPPGTVANLTVESVFPGSIGLRWTAPGDNGNVGQASSYIIRYSLQPLSASTFGSALPTQPQPPAPQVAGGTEHYVATGLQPQTTYYFALEAVDPVGNISTLSNVVQGTTSADIAPAGITNLSASPRDPLTIHLSWTAVKDQSGTGGGAAAVYDLRYSKTPITAANFQTSLQAQMVPAPGAPGASESLDLTESLEPNTTYYFAIKAIDHVGVAGAISNVVSSAPEACDVLFFDTVESALAGYDLSHGFIGSNPGNLWNRSTRKSYAGSWSWQYADPNTGTYNTGSLSNKGWLYLPPVTTNNHYQVFWSFYYQTDMEPSPPGPEIFTHSHYSASPSLPQTPSGQWKRQVDSFPVTTPQATLNEWLYFDTVDALNNTGAGVFVDNIYLIGRRDLAPPEAVQNLQVASVGFYSIDVQFTAAGDDGPGTAPVPMYQIAHSTSPITAANFAQATVFPLTFSGPPPSGSIRTTVNGLNPATTYYLAVRAVDKVGRLGPISNVVTQATPSFNTVPPKAITDLRVVDGPYDSVVTVNWTNPSVPSGDTGLSFEIRQSTSPLTAQNFSSAALANSTPVTGGARLYSLAPATTYYVGVRTTSLPSGLTSLSNFLSFTTTARIPPAQITDLTSLSVQPTQAQLQFTGVGDNGKAGFAWYYLVKGSLHTIATISDFNAATDASLQINNQPLSGQAYSFAFGTLLPGTTYWIAVVAYDLAGNEGPLSNVLMVTTPATPPNGQLGAINDLTAGNLGWDSATLSFLIPAQGTGYSNQQTMGLQILTSTQPITAANADQAYGGGGVGGMPIPNTPGALYNLNLSYVSLTPSGFVRGAKYYIAARYTYYSTKGPLSNLCILRPPLEGQLPTPVRIQAPWTINTNPSVPAVGVWYNTFVSDSEINLTFTLTNYPLPQNSSNYTFTLSSAPTGAVLYRADAGSTNPTGINQYFRWVPNRSQAGDHKLHIRVDLANGLHDETDFYIRVIGFQSPFLEATAANSLIDTPALGAFGNILGDGRYGFLGVRVNGGTPSLIYLKDATGADFPGWPISEMLGPGSTGAPAVLGALITDMDGDGKMEIFLSACDAGGNAKIFGYRSNGIPLSGFPVSLPNPGRQMIAADADQTGTKQLFVFSGFATEGAIYRFNLSGQVLPGWPVRGGYFALGHLVGTSALQLATYASSAVLAYDMTGKLLPGWPFSHPLGHDFGTRPTLADFTGSGRDEVLIKATNQLATLPPYSFVLSPDGALMPGWPKPSPSTDAMKVARLDPTSSDLHIVDAEMGPWAQGFGISLFRLDGSTLPQSPLQGFNSDALRIFDVNGDGVPEIFWGFASSDMEGITSLNGTPIDLQGTWTKEADQQKPRTGPLLGVADVRGTGKATLIYERGLVDLAIPYNPQAIEWGEEDHHVSHRREYIRPVRTGSLLILSPRTGYRLSAVSPNGIVVSGSVTDPSVTQITVAGKATRVVNGRFNTLVPLSAGTNTIVASGTVGGAAASDQVTVTYDAVPPHLTLLSPLANLPLPGTGELAYATNDPGVQIQGTVDKPEVTVVRVEISGLSGQSAPGIFWAPVFSGTFVVDVPVLPALQPNGVAVENVRVIATDLTGNQGSTELKLWKNALLPSIRIDQPAFGSTVAGNPTVSGFVSDHLAPTILINGQPTPIANNLFSGLAGLVYGGSQEIPISLTDRFGNVAQNSIEVFVTGLNMRPTASVQASPTSGNAALLVSFNGTGSSDPDGTVASYAWNFGDGQTGSGATVTHLYTTPGSFVAMLTVTDNLGATGSATVSITVNAANLAPTFTSPSTAQGALGSPFRYTLSASGAAPISYSVSNLPAGLSFSGNAITGTPTTGGTFYVTLSASDPYGSGGMTLTLSVSAPPTGAVDAWGQNNLSQLGDTTTTNRNAPVPVSGLTSGLQVSAGQAHSLAVRTDGSVWSWGWNTYGQLGNGNNNIQSSPVAVSGLSGVTVAAAGATHSLAVKTDGTVWSWGSNSSGELGNGTTTDRNTPGAVSSLSGITAVAAGSNFSLALRSSDGSVWAWGLNGNGQLGLGTTSGHTTPTQVPGLSGIVAISAGAVHAVAVKSDGTVWAWGWNLHSQLGDGTTTQRLSPVRVSVISNLTALASGYAHNLGLKSDGTIWAWGWNSSGQLGDGTTTDRATPVQITGITGVTKFACGDGHTLALKSDKTALSWGSNSNGQLGNGTNTDHSTPLPIPGLSNLSGLAAGSGFSVGLLGGGGANVAPVSQPQSLSVTIGTPQPLTLVATDGNGDTLTYAVVGPPSHGSLGGVPPQLTYTPASGYTGPDSFTFKANDGHVDSNIATVTITVHPANAPPVVSAGKNQTVTLPNSAQLAGTVVDDGLPVPPGALAVSWLVVSGPGPVTFANPSWGSTSAAFQTAGTYDLRLVASDGQATSQSDVTITVLPQFPNNHPPVANAGPNQTVLAGSATVILDGTGSTDDGLLDPLVYHWDTLLHPANAPLMTSTSYLGDPDSPHPYFSPRVSGFYRFQLTVGDGQYTSTSTVDITVTDTVGPSVSITSPGSGASFAAPASIPITAMAFDPDGQIQSVQFYQGATLIGTVTTSPYTLTWSSVPAGTYALTAVATDAGGLKTTSSSVSIVVTGSTTYPLGPVADAYVRDGSYAATNFGTANPLQVKQSNAGYNREAYFTFDLTPVAGSVTSAKLQLYGNINSANVSNLVLAVYPVASTSWTETGITWNNRPPAGSTALASLTVPDTTPRWYVWDVTSYVQSQKQAGQTRVSFDVRMTTFETGDYVVFNSREAPSNTPLLVVVDPPLAAPKVQSATVAAGGNIALNGAGSFASIQKALDAARPGETVTLGAGRFLLPAGLQVPGGVSLRGAAPHQTILDGQGAPRVIQLAGTPLDGRSTISLLTVTNGSVGIDVGVGDALLQNLQIVRCSGDGILTGTQGKLEGVSLTVSDNGGNGIFAFHPQASFRGVIASGNGRFAINAPSGFGVRYSDFFMNRLGSVTGGVDSGGPGNLFKVVDYRDAEGLDYRELPGAPTVDAGDPEDPFDLEPLPNGHRINQGAFGNTPDALTSP
jgi:alpha-tubulin suppressor-like RCC1 family protein/subtilisin family serine protease